MLRERNFCRGKFYIGFWRLSSFAKVHGLSMQYPFSSWFAWFLMPFEKGFLFDGGPSHMPPFTSLSGNRTTCPPFLRWKSVGTRSGSVHENFPVKFWNCVDCAGCLLCKGAHCLVAKQCSLLTFLFVLWECLASVHFLACHGSHWWLGYFILGNV